MTDLPNTTDPFALHDPLSAVAAASERLLAGIGTLPVTPSVEAGTLREWLAQFQFDEPVPLDQLIGLVEPKLRSWNLHPAHPRYFGLFNPPALPAGVVGDTLAALYNPQIGTWPHAPLGNEIERHVLDHFASHLGLPAEGRTAHFTTGGQEANSTAALVALNAAFPGVAERGVRSLEADPVCYVSESAHHSFLRAAGFIGLGRRAVKTIPVDRRESMVVSELEGAIAADRAAGRAPFMVVGTLGTTGSGATDPLPEIADIAAREQFWFHVDAAWAGAALLSPRLRFCGAGIERADSVTWDAHKWLSVPMGAGMFFTRHAHVLSGVYRTETGYVPQVEDLLREQHQMSFQWSRRHIGLKVFFALANIGVPGYARLIEHQCAVADAIRARASSRGWVVANQTVLPIVCLGHQQLDSADQVEQVVGRVVGRGRAWVSSLRYPGGRAVIRICITSPLATDADADILMEELDLALGEMSLLEQQGDPRATQ